MMRTQGIKGPSYKFIHGNTKEIINMRKSVKSTLTELSHHELLPRVQPHIHAWIKLYGMNFLYWHGPQAQLIVTEPDMIKEIFSNKDGAFPKKELPVYMKKLLGDGIVATKGEKWLKLRKLSNHAFHAECLKVSMIPAMIASVEVILERWRQHDGKEIEVYQEFKILTSEIISRTAFGSSYLEGQHIFDMLARMGDIIIRNSYKITIPGIGNIVKLSDDIESEKLEQEIRNSFINMIMKREKAAMEGKWGGFGSDFLGSLLLAHHDTDKAKIISVEDMIDECKTFYVAGQETTRSSLTWTVLLLAIHTDWQDKARREVLELFGLQNPSPEGIAKLKTVSMIINESLRLYCPAVQIPRIVHKEVRLGKLILPANTEIIVPLLVVHQNPEIWGEDAHLFKPERFADGIAKATNSNTAAFLPFGLGPRSCVGLNFSVTETKIALAMILQHYRFTLSPTYVHSPVHLITMSPRHGVQIMLEAL
ncbi:unnamed protein product [Dovyalis caffra]|uniref:Cytochrome P450 n=1 Tax=Dovyalis caffra TaxID=77055 RepID=A0AAV1QZ57_9ROSI|nr:unnamed protein product [Dovyalis caffra]